MRKDHLRDSGVPHDRTQEYDPVRGLGTEPGKGGPMPHEASRACTPGYSVVLLVGGTDPSGGAGLSADLKAVAAAGCHGCPAVTAVTVQNAGRVYSWSPVEPSSIAAQIEACLEDGAPGAVKSGMIGTAGALDALASILAGDLAGVPYVLDPVLTAGSGDSLHDEGLSAGMIEKLLPLCTLCTPNLDEASVLSGIEVKDRHSMEEAGRRILSMGPSAVLVKGGHLEGPPADLLVKRGSTEWMEGRRIVRGKVHGAGCTLASSAAARLALGYDVSEAVRAARIYLAQALGSSFTRRTGRLLGHLPPAGPARSDLDADAFYLPPRFCIRCGTPLYEGSGISGHPACPACGLVSYRNPIPAVTLVVRRGGEILLARRAKAPYRGALSLPGGFLETGETVAECASRELREETGLEAASFSLIGVETDSTAYGAVVLAVMEAVGWTGDAVAGDDASELSWYGLDDVPPLAFRAHERIVSDLAGRD